MFMGYYPQESLYMPIPQAHFTVNMHGLGKKTYISPIYPYILGVYGLLSPKIPIYAYTAGTFHCKYAWIGKKTLYKHYISLYSGCLWVIIPKNPYISTWNAYTPGTFHCKYAWIGKKRYAYPLRYFQHKRMDFGKRIPGFTYGIILGIYLGGGS